MGKKSTPHTSAQPKYRLTALPPTIPAELSTKETLIHSGTSNIWQDDEGLDDGGWERLGGMGEVGLGFWRTDWGGNNVRREL